LAPGGENPGFKIQKFKPDKESEDFIKGVVGEGRRGGEEEEDGEGDRRRRTRENFFAFSFAHCKGRWIGRHDGR